MKKTFWSTALLLSTLTTASAAPAADLPRPIQALLEQVKGDWYVLSNEYFDGHLNLQADGRGHLINTAGEADITWALSGGQIKITLLSPIVSYETATEIGEDGAEVDYTVANALTRLSFTFQKLEGLTILWKTSAHWVTSYEGHPEKGTTAADVDLENVKLVANKQFKKFQPALHQVTSLLLPDFNYTDSNGDIFENRLTGILARYDEAHALTLVGGQDIGTDHLGWTLDNGTLQAFDGKGYAANYRIFTSDSVSAKVLVEYVKNGVHGMASDETVTVNPQIQAQGFTADSPLFKGCVKALQATYCFDADHAFSIIFHYPDQADYTAYGAWNLENGKLHGVRYKNEDGSNPDRATTLACAQPGATCKVYQTRTYELLNQNARHIGVGRVLNTSDYPTEHAFHSFEIGS